MITQGTMILKNRNPFCLFNKQEVGIASGYFAGDRFAETDGDEYISEVSGQSFGWYDSSGHYFCESKHSMSRPTDEEIVLACLKFEQLKIMALGMGLIEIIEKQVSDPEDEEPSPSVMAGHIGKIFLN